MTSLMTSDGPLPQDMISSAAAAKQGLTDQLAAMSAANKAAQEVAKEANAREKATNEKYRTLKDTAKDTAAKEKVIAHDCSLKPL